jgi:diguanylate cyclase (GGDEF)-like protein
VSVLAVDVDHLREVNDSAGHETGDAVLCAIAHTLRDRLGDIGVLARTGGDEFGVLLPGVEAGTAIAVAEELRRSVHAAPVMIPWLPRASVGLATALPDADPRSAWDAALEALELAKRWGRDRVETRRVSGGTTTRRLAWELMVPQLFEEGRLEAVYQPVVRLSDGHLVGYEALARPAGFAGEADVDGLFAAARAAGLHRDLDWACRRAAVRGAAGLPEGVPLFLNVGVWALMDPLHDVDQMLLLLRWMDIPPTSVVLELSEREAVHDLDRLRTVMAAYRAHGLRFSIDDVGEGHSTLDMLAAGSPDFIKIARSLVAAADLPGPRAAISAVVAFAVSSNAQVVAEGVESSEEAERLAAMGVGLGQGFWLGPPVRLPVRSTALAS